MLKEKIKEIIIQKSFCKDKDYSEVCDATDQILQLFLDSLPKGYTEPTCSEGDDGFNDCLNQIKNNLK